MVPEIGVKSVLDQRWIPIAWKWIWFARRKRSGLVGHSINYENIKYFTRRDREWALADRVVVNSEFSRQALLQQSVPDEKLVVIPLCYEAKGFNQKLEIGNWKSDQPLRVLFLGQVILRKGIQYLFAAARQLERENIHFDVVGPVGISREAISSAPANVTFSRASRSGSGCPLVSAIASVCPAHAL